MAATTVLAEAVPLDVDVVASTATVEVKATLEATFLAKAVVVAALPVAEVVHRLPMLKCATYSL